MSDLWICKHHKACDRDCNRKYTFRMDHLRYWVRQVNSRANWYRINCHNFALADDYGQSVAIRWKGETNG
jgi:hypothetical protein